MIFERHEEYNYLKLVQDIISNGNTKDDRTGTGTLSKFGSQMRFNLRKSFPLLTTKKIFWRAVVEEILWFISGSTNAKVLKEKGIHIWDGNASRDYLDSIGLTDREEGDLGPVYGIQWRHFDLVPGDFVHAIGDAHVYRTHVRPLQKQLQKLPRPFPTLKISSEKKDIDSFVANDFKLMDYDPRRKIEMKMAV
ncbi:hypothetical protein MKW92_019382 [Papaver armeniacum]|nr:hypothetical protein MKW92_019382 [Papaver armeniacum]